MSEFDGDVAHQVEQRTENPCVAGSSPAVATNIYNNLLQTKVLLFNS